MSARDTTLEELCRRLKVSDATAFEQVFRLLRTGLVRYVRALINDDVVAHDLVQDIFVYLWDLRETLDPSQSLKAYLYRMARNRAYRFMRDERAHAEKHAILKRTSSAHRPASEGPDAQVDIEALTERLRGWISELPERQREALVLSRFHQLSHREIASVMGVSPRTVNNHIMRALEHLQGRIQIFEPTLIEP